MEAAVVAIELGLLVVSLLVSATASRPRPEFLNELTGVPPQGVVCVEPTDLPQQPDEEDVTP